MHNHQITLPGRINLVEVITVLQLRLEGFMGEDSTGPHLVACRRTE